MGQSKKIIAAVSDGSEMQCYLAAPSRPSSTSVMVFPEIFGVNAHIRDVADRLAAEGYWAVAPEIFHRTAPRDWEGSYTDMNGSMAHVKALTPEMTLADIKATYDLAKKESKGDRVGAVGFCMGGRLSFMANGTLPLKAAISYYGAGIAPGLLNMVEKQSGPLLFFWGGKDKHIPPEQTRALNDALTKAEKPFIDVLISFADHGFLNHEKPVFNEKAASEAWSLTLAFLKAHT